MKIIQFHHAGETQQVGIVDGDYVIPVNNYTNTLELIREWSNAKDKIQGNTNSKISLSQVKLLAPLVPERNIFCVGWNYLSHFNESIGKREGQEVDLPERPTFFSKLPTTIIGPEDDIPLHEKHTSRLDWEIELAVVIGKQGRDISEQNALDHVFGYTIANDISARDLQRAHGAQWFKGKSLDGTCPLGPILVTADEIPDPQNLALQCRLNGEVMQDSHTRRQIFTVRRVIAELSAGLTLLPGDIILTGTPEGIGNARTPPVYLKDGDNIECEIENLGLLRNRIRKGL